MRLKHIIWLTVIRYAQTTTFEIIGFINILTREKLWNEPKCKTNRKINQTAGRSMLYFKNSEKMILKIHLLIKRIFDSFIVEFLSFSSMLTKWTFVFKNSILKLSMWLSSDTQNLFLTVKTENSEVLTCRQSCFS